MLVYARLNPRLESSHRALGFGEPLRKLDFELRDLMRRRCDASKDVARKQAYSEPVRVVKNNRIIDPQAKR